MIYSMTGFGRTTVQLDKQSYTIEIKTLNSKQFDLNLRIPNYLREKEMDIRNMLVERVKRGKVEVFINSSKGADTISGSFNHELISEYMEQLSSIQSQYSITDSDVLNALLRLPNVLVTEEKELLDSEWNTFKSALGKCIESLVEFRTQEGKAMGIDLEERINSISKNAAAVEIIAPGRIEKIRERIHSNLEQLQLKTDFDKQRFEQEMIYYLEKFDITEEIVRLKNHCSYFTENLHSKVEMKGKKLNFISQELGREINTIGSKANDMEIQKLVVAMKDELEKIKEQLNNIL